MSKTNMRELEVELAKIGPDAFCQKYGATQHAINPLSRIQRAVISQLERGTDEGYRLAEADRGAEVVGHADEANRIARDAVKISKEANRVALAAFILAAIALALSLGLFV